MGANSFTLVEVVIAVAVTAFALVTLMGLLSYALQIVQQSDNYSRLSHVAGQVLASVNSRPYATSVAYAQTNATFYFTYDGLPTNQAAAYYQCSLTNANPAASVLTNATWVQVNICWPVPECVHTNVIVSSTLKYD